MYNTTYVYKGADCCCLKTAFSATVGSMNG